MRLLWFFSRFSLATVAGDSLKVTRFLSSAGGLGLRPAPARWPPLGIDIPEVFNLKRFLANLNTFGLGSYGG